MGSPSIKGGSAWAATFLGPTPLTCAALGRTQRGRIAAGAAPEDGDVKRGFGTHGGENLNAGKKNLLGGSLGSLA
ncbi:MAG: hypothetical protein ACOYM3_14395 [Terrimicrobiaceae bacterium]